MYIEEGVPVHYKLVASKLCLLLHDPKYSEVSHKYKYFFIQGNQIIRYISRGWVHVTEQKKLIIIFCLHEICKIIS